MSGGSIGRRGDGWRARINGKDSAGNRKQISHQCKTKKEAEAWARAELHRRDTGTYLEPATITVGEYLEEWLILARSRNLRPSSLYNYTDRVRRHIIPALGDVRLQQLQPLHITRLLAALAPYAPAHQKEIYRILRQALRQAVAMRLIPDNVAANVHGPRGDYATMQCWTEEQTRAFLTHAEGDYRMLWQLALGLGLRRGELLGLRWADLDFAHGTIAIRQQATYHAGTWHFGPPKTPASRRTLDLDSRLADQLRAHRLAQLQTQMRHKPLWHAGDLVITDQVGKPPWSKGITGALRQAAQSASVPAIRLHDMRHTYATTALARGTSVHVVARHLGHTDPAITMRRYAHVLPQDGKALAKLMGDVLYG